jgi:hypothetical protein
MTSHFSGVNPVLVDGSVRFAPVPGPAVTLQALLHALRQAGCGATVAALGPQVPALQATLSHLRAGGLALGPAMATPHIGPWSAMLVLPSAASPGQAAAGIGFISLPAGPAAIGLLLPAVRSLQEVSARMRMKFDMRLVMVQPTASAKHRGELEFVFHKIELHGSSGDTTATLSGGL